MSETIRPTRRSIRRAHRGQMLFIALSILFILLFIGGFFIVQIGRNLNAAGRSRDTQQTAAFAVAAINYCDQAFTYSEDGADWRPAPTPPINGVTDPDYQWLSQGWTRLFFEGGRALVHIVYDPHPDDPRSQYIRIEAVGRSGDLGQGQDPTVFVQNGNVPRLRTELIAYKELGLTDYMLWMTDKDGRTNENFIGTPTIRSTQTANAGGFEDIATVLGDPTLAANLAANLNGVVGGKEIIYGAPIRCDGNLRIGGDTYIYESPRGNSANLSPEGLLCAGQIDLAPTRDINGDGKLDSGDHSVFVNQPLIGGTANLFPSGDPNFTTDFGIVRDGSSFPDVNGYNRNIKHLLPPQIDTYIPTTGRLRYRAITRESGFWVGTAYNTGFNGWGQNLYIDNTTDLQTESQTVNGGFSLRADWLNPNAGFPNSAWSGPFYRPPGVLIELKGDHLTLTRNDGKSFRKPDGTPIVGAGGTVLDIPLSDAARAGYLFPDGTANALPALPRDGDTPANHDPNPANFPGDKNSYGVNLVIMAEGNVRVKGVYGAVSDSTTAAGDHLGRVHLTIVTGGTAYIEGNIVKGDGFFSGAGVVPERGSTCAILAKDYVCVNTTMFMAPQNQTNAWTPVPGQESFYTQIGSTRPTVDFTTGFGIDPAAYTTGGAPSPLYALLRHASDNNTSNTSSGMNLLVNPGLDNTAASAPVYLGNSVYLFNEPPAGFPPQTYPLGLRWNAGTNTFDPDPTQVAPNFESRAFALRGGIVGGNFQPSYYAPGGGASVFFPTFNGPINGGTMAGVYSGLDNIFRFQKDTAAASVPGYSEDEDYLLSAAMVTPLDIRIEALLYAQEKSFFVIPGYSFNSDPNDTRTIYNQNANDFRPSYSNFDVGTDKLAKAIFPFYNEPVDARITIFGAISMNYTASAGDQAAWMSRWGWIPTLYGSTGSGKVNALPAVQIPDAHLMVHDPLVNGAQIYNPAEDITTDARTQLEKNEGITRGLRYIYDPALAMPYQHATDVNIINPATRAFRALRTRTVQVNGVNVNVTLPPIPRLPVCPGLLYFGNTDHPLGQ